MPAKKTRTRAKTARSPNGDRWPPQAARARLASILDASDDAVIGSSFDGIVTDWTRGAEQMFGYTAREMIGSSILRVFPAGRESEEAQIAGRVARGESVELADTRRKTRDGRLLHVAMKAAPIRDQTDEIVGVARIIRDVTSQKHDALQLQRMTRLYAAFSQVSQAINRTRSMDELFERVCKALVEHGGFFMAWIGWHDPQTKRIVPRAVAGDCNDYIRNVVIYSDERPEGMGPTGRSFRSGRPYICNDMLEDPVTLPWRAELVKRGLNASAVFPIRVAGAVQGTLMVYSDDGSFFQDKEISLLEETAHDISFALDDFQERERRRQAEQQTEAERLFSSTMIESMPGILYFYDAEGRFLRWNRNFETVSGYSGAEIARMHPLDFFRDSDKPLLEQRIAKVFADGESSVEASFQSKDGRVTDYLFTGRRVVINEKPCLVGMGIDISLRKQAEEARQAVEERYRSLFQHAPDGILVADTQGYYRDGNPSICRMLGYSHEEFVRLHSNDIVVPEEADRVKPAIDDIRSRADYHREWRFRRKDGSVFPAEVFAAMMPDGNILAVIRDITERKQAEEAQRESERRFADAFEHAPIGMTLSSLEGRLLKVNRALCQMLGYSRPELSAKTWQEITHPDDLEEDLTYVNELLAGKIANYEMEKRYLHKDGHAIWILLSVSLHRDEQGRPVYFIAQIQDVSQRKRAEHALHDLNVNLERQVAARTDELQTALVRAEAADRIKSAFLATMSHELRTPLNSIIGFTGIILQGLAGPLNPEQTKQLGMVRTSAHHLLALINDVLDISKIEAGQLEIRTQPFNLRESLENVAGTVKPMADKKGLELRLAIETDLQDMLSDRRRVEQILLNLLNNAVKFTERGSVTLTVVKMDAWGPDARQALRLVVADTGIGIKARDLGLLFEPFRQVDAGTARQHEGTGLGLAICRRLVTLLGGEISVRSDWGHGTDFTVILPLLEDLPR